MEQRLTSGARTARAGHGPRPGLALLFVVLMILVAMALGWDNAASKGHTTSAASSKAHEPVKQSPALRSSGSQSGGTPIDARAFASGACMAFAPTAANRGRTVFLDAGHGGIDPGGVGTTNSGETIYEANETLAVELDAMTMLRADGYRVVVSRTENSTVLKLGPGDESNGALTLQGAHDDVAARDSCANDAGAQVLVGIYFDAGTAQNAGSLTAYDTDRPFSSQNLAFANLLQNDVLDDMDAQGWAIPNDGVLPDDQLGSYVGDPSSGGIAGAAASYNHLLLIGPAVAGFFTTPSTMPGAIIEPLYLTDPFEGSIADSSSGQTVMARGIASAVEQFLSPPASSSPSTTTG
jgi:N-acetylmuramoyl-L-alanine amidase